MKSRSLLCRTASTGSCGLKNIWPQKLQVHQAGSRDSIVTPLGNGLCCYLANSRYLIGSAESINDLICVHDQLKHTLHLNVKSALHAVG